MIDDVSYWEIIEVSSILVRLDFNFKTVHNGCIMLIEFQGMMIIH